nr:hypothetical protein [Tanacetum cinerariifolium]
LKELAEYDNSLSKDRPIFLNDNEEHSVQNEESLENSSNEIDASSSNQEKEEPLQDFDIRKLIREECCVKVCEEQKQSMEDTMLELVKICRQKELLCIHDNVEDLIESALNSKLLSINSQRLDKKEQEVKNVVEQPAERGNRSIKSLQNFRVIRKSSTFLKDTSQISPVHAIAPILSTEEPEHSLSMGYEHLSITPETESNEVTESNAENLLPIPSECEVTSEDEKITESDFDFEEEIRLIENLLYDNSSPRPPKELNAEIADTIVESILSLPIPIQDGDSQREEIDIVTETDDVLPPSVEKDDDSTNGPLLEETDLFIASDNSIPPGIENIANNSEGDIHFQEELLIDDSILSHESSDSNFGDNPSVPRPPPEPPDAETDAGEEIPVVIKDKDKFDEDYYFFMFDKVFSLLSAESEDTIFDPFRICGDVFRPIRCFQTARVYLGNMGTWGCGVSEMEVIGCGEWNREEGVDVVEKAAEMGEVVVQVVAGNKGDGTVFLKRGWKTG